MRSAGSLVASASSLRRNPAIAALGLAGAVAALAQQAAGAPAFDNALQSICGEAYAATDPRALDDLGDRAAALLDALGQIANDDANAAGSWKRTADAADTLVARAREELSNARNRPSFAGRDARIAAVDTQIATASANSDEAAALMRRHTDLTSRVNNAVAQTGTNLLDPRTWTSSGSNRGNGNVDREGLTRAQLTEKLRKLETIEIPAFLSRMAGSVGPAASRDLLAASIELNKIDADLRTRRSQIVAGEDPDQAARVKAAEDKADAAEKDAREAHEYYDVANRIAHNSRLALATAEAMTPGLIDCIATARRYLGDGSGGGDNAPPPPTTVSAPPPSTGGGRTARTTSVCPGVNNPPEAGTAQVRFNKDSAAFTLYLDGKSYELAAYPVNARGDMSGARNGRATDPKDFVKAWSGHFDNWGGPDANVTGRGRFDLELDLSFLAGLVGAIGSGLGGFGGGGGAADNGQTPKQLPIACTMNWTVP